MKVLFVYSYRSSFPDLSDPITHIQGESLRKNGIDLQFFGVKGRGWRGYCKAIFELKSYLKNNKFDIVHGHYSYCGFVAALANNGRTIVSLMGSDIKANWFWILMIKLFSKFIWKKTIVKSRRMKSDINLKNAVVIPNGVDLSVFEPLNKEFAQKRVKFSNKKKNIIFVGNKERKEKNFQLLGKAFDLLDGKNDMEFHLVSGVSQKELSYYYNAADLLVLTSLWEGSPNVIKEAMACNCPIVATDVGDVRERFAGTQGCYRTTFEFDDVARKIRLALAYDQRTNGREKIKGIEINKIAQRIIELYNQVVVPVDYETSGTKRQVCSRCILDAAIQEIEFDENGVCNFCKLYEELDKEYSLDVGGQRRLNQLIEEIKAAGKNKEYDCIVGVSGGADSSYTLYMAKKLGLRPMAVHLDNGWDTEVGVSNIKNITSRLGVDLETKVLDWEEFKDLQIAFLKASVPSVEEPTDLAVIGALYQAASKYGIQHVLYGLSFRTEGNMPFSWGYSDGKYIKGIHKMYGKRELKTFPHLTLLHTLYYLFIKRIKLIRLLNYIDYKREKVKEILQKELRWKDYGGHHYESIYTRFYYSYISPHKFNMDRRKIPLSALIRAGQITREEALKRIAEEPYPKDRIEEDKEYIAKKLGMTKKEFEEILSLPPKTFLDYPSYYPLVKRFKFLFKIASNLKIIPLIYDEKRFSLSK